MPVRGDRVVPTQEEAADPKLTDLAQPERALCGCKRPGHQDPAQEMQLPQEQRVSARTKPTPLISMATFQRQICTQRVKAPSFIRCFLSERARPVCLSEVCAEI